MPRKVSPQNMTWIHGWCHPVLGTLFSLFFSLIFFFSVCSWVTCEQFDVFKPGLSLNWDNLCLRISSILRSESSSGHISSQGRTSVWPANASWKSGLSVTSKRALVTVFNAAMACFYKCNWIPAYILICKTMLWNIQRNSGITGSSHHWRQHLKIPSLSATTWEWEGSHMMN